MPWRSFTEHHDIAKVVEKQMRNWELTQAQRPDAEQGQATTVRSFITISRVVGAGADEVVARLSETLGWSVFDKEILQSMAGDDAVRQRLYESMDERDLGWLEETVRSLMHTEFPKNDYLHKLTETVLTVSRQGRAIFLGRAIDLILPEEMGLRVRIVAPPERCAQQYAGEHDLSIEESRRAVASLQRERERFVEKHFGRLASDPCRYDLTINLQRYGAKEAAELILSALRARGIKS